MADVLNPVREECVKHGLNEAQLDPITEEYRTSQQSRDQNGRTGKTTVLNMGLSLFWWSTGPVRHVASKLVNLNPAAGEFARFFLNISTASRGATFHANLNVFSFRFRSYYCRWAGILNVGYAHPRVYAISYQAYASIAAVSTIFFFLIVFHR